jgi:polysaccharide export outer membrane protein
MKYGKNTTLTMLLMLASALAPSTRAQQAQAPKLEPGQHNQLAQFEAAQEAEYILGIGDHIYLDVDGRAELSGAHVLGPDGKITLPIVGEISLDGLTRENAAAAIANALQPYYRNISVTVRVTDYQSNKVTVLGSVEHPGSILFESTPTLLDAVSRAGYLGLAGGPRNMPETAIIYRGESQSVTVKLAELMANGDPLANLRLKKNDVIYLPAPKQKFVSVMGAVVHPGAISLDSGDSLAMILGEAGGPLQEASKTNMVVVDATTGRQRKVTMDDVLNPSRSAELHLHSGDIVYVPRSNMAKVGFVLDKFNPLFSAAGLSGFILH